MPSPAREAAFDILLRVEQRQAYASELLHSDRLGKLSPQDRGFCTELVMGTLRWRSRLDLAIAAVSSQPLQKLDPEVLTALRLGAYQIGFLRLPARAAVNESVELVKRARRRFSVPFANAVLRKVAAKPELVEPALSPGPKTIPELAELYAHPLWLVERWAVAYGLERTEKACAFDQQVPAAAVRLRDLEVEKELQREGVELAPGALLASARRVIKGDIAHTRAVVERRATIQDEASQLIALLVGSGDRVLDCCAAPGNKAAMIAERNPEADVIATELHPHRAAAMQERLAGIANLTVVAADIMELPVAGKFDRVLADVPCSGTGTLARNPEIKWRLSMQDLAELHVRQVGILAFALDRLRPGGRLIYSSCSLEPEENADVIKEVVAADGEVNIADCRAELERLHDSGELACADLDSLLDGPFLRTLPGVLPCDGFFAAILERT
ncbi:MAG: transcription antitermination factor NusB [Terriglobales bacterium]